tara:strand:- start:5244 stop:5534 length:291 start_codon:yes stop_codon:yes gene_type:complete
MTTCANCSHWRFARQGNVKSAGECRRHAPQPSITGGAVVETQWPITLEDDSCAEFKGAPVNQKSALEAADTTPASDPTPMRMPRQTTQGGKRRNKR